jgi:hypothetical protein
VSKKKITVRPSPDENWKNNDIQFPRLLAEILAVGALTPQQMGAICESMDLDAHEVNEIFDRAERVWEEIKKRT